MIIFSFFATFLWSMLQYTVFQSYICDSYFDFISIQNTSHKTLNLLKPFKFYSKPMRLCANLWDYALTIEFMLKHLRIFSTFEILLQSLRVNTPIFKILLQSWYIDNKGTLDILLIEMFKTKNMSNKINVSSTRCWVELM